MRRMMLLIATGAMLALMLAMAGVASAQTKEVEVPEDSESGFSIASENSAAIERAGGGESDEDDGTTAYRVKTEVAFQFDPG